MTPGDGVARKRRAAMTALPVIRSLSEEERASLLGELEARVRQALRVRRCAECGADLHHETVPRSAFCTAKHRYAFRDRWRYLEDPERERERSRRYYAENRERVLEKAAAKRALRPPLERSCAECGEPLSGRQRVVCSRRRCKDARFRRLHPEAWREAQRRKDARRRPRRKGGDYGTNVRFPIG
jgi:hypothetical protein